MTDVAQLILFLH